ncbi:MAG: family 78 glycoside hydrolase catalytic domain [Firmicutes bacterium]|nr:family 78 glycoside hydrolase catalytic domain [Bacillota bacterium]
MDKHQWRARWITPEEKAADPEQRPGAGFLRKEFRVEVVPEKAELFITAHGLYEAYLNGQKISEDVLTPGCDEYDKRLQYQVYEVQHLLKAGENEMKVILGDGWYRGCNGIDGTRNLFGSDLSLLAEMYAENALICLTDESWEGSMDGPILLTDLELGETYDAGKEEIRKWHKASVLTQAPKPAKGLKQAGFGYDTLVRTDTLPVREKEIMGGYLFKTKDGSYVYDFRQNLAGFTRLRITGAKAGERVTLIHGETLDENGNFTNLNFQPGERNKSGGIAQKIEYICKDGDQVYQPRFSMFGFRYAKIESDLSLENIRVEAVAVYSDMEQTAFFECGEPKVNRLFKNSIWSMKGNFCDIPTDCPTRERAGWTGDAGVFAPTGLILMNSRKVWEKWLANVRLCQHQDGKMAYIAPINGKPGMISEMFSASVGWGDASILVPWAIYEVYGDEKVLRDNYEMMKKWVDFLERRAKKTRVKELVRRDPYRKYIIDTGMDYGEWSEPGANVMETMKQASLHGQPEVATAYYAHSALLLGKIAEILGEEKDAERYTNLGYKVRNAYRNLVLRDGHIVSKRQCEYVRPIAFRLLNAVEERQAAADLDEKVRENGYHLNTGFLSTPFLTEVLADHGYTDTAYRLLLQEECPSWLYAVEKGATTIWETWDGIREDGTVHDSLNHYSYGAISGWLIKGVCGIRYRHDELEIRPHPDPSLGYAKATYHSPKGRIVSGWQYKKVAFGTEKKAVYHIEIPEGLLAKVFLPDGQKFSLEAGSYDL